MKGCYEALLIHTLLYILLDFRVAYAASISEHLTIRLKSVCAFGRDRIKWQ